MHCHFRKYILFWIVLICLLLPTLYVNGQNTRVLTLDPSKAISQYGLSSWNSLDGLPQNTIGALAQTPDGYVWIGTQEGLVRFDGVDFTVFNRKNTSAFSTSTINHLTVSPNGSLLIGTRGGGLIEFDQGTFSVLTEADGLSSGFSTSLEVDSKGDVWFGTFEGGLNRISGGDITVFGADQGLPGRAISFVGETSEGKIWAGSGDGVFVLAGERFVPHPDPNIAPLYITAQFQTQDGTQWIGTRDGALLAYQNDQLSDFSDFVSVPGSYLKDVWEDVEGSMWFGFRGNGLFRRTENGRFEQFSEAEGLSNNGVLSLMEDREGGLWVGTNNGLNRLQNGKFDTFTTLEGLSNDMARSIHEDASGTVWIATMDGVNSFKDGGFKHYGVLDGLSSENTFSVISDDSGDIWVGTTGQGLNRISSSGIQTFTEDDGLSGMEIYALHTAKDGRVWIGTENGLSIYDGRGFINFTPEEGLSSPFVTDFEEAANGDMWVATYDGGINLVSDEGISVTSSENGLANDGVFALYADMNGDLWIGTYGDGLNILTGAGTILHVDSRKGLFDDTIFSILEDDLGYMWFTSNRGIFRALKKDLMQVAIGESDYVESRGYGISDGLKTSEANGGQQPSAWKGKDGTLWFPMAEGIVAVNPSTVPSNVKKPIVHIQDFLVDYKLVPFENAALGNGVIRDSDVIILPAGSDKLEFKYVGLSYVAPEKVLFETMLKGHDQDWSPVSSQTKAYFTNLGPGEYEFSVRAVNGDGIWSDADETLAFIIEPYFYQTLWFKMLSLFLTVFALALGYKVRIRQMELRQRELEQTVEERTHDLRNEKEITEKAKEVIEAQAEKLKELDQFKTKFFANVSHEFRTPLTLLIGPLENALHGAYGVISDSMRQQAEIMLRNAQRLMRLINQLMDLSKLEAGKMQLQAQKRNIVPFLEGLLLTFTPFAEKKNIDLTFTSSDEDLDVYYEPDKLEKVFFNLLSNAAKFTEHDGEISIDVQTFGERGEFKKGGVEIRVTDTGQGMPAEDLPYIFDRFRQAEGSSSKDQAGTGIGLSLVKELVILHHGSIRVESELGKGTTFIIELHQGRLHLLEEDVVAENNSGNESFVEFAAHDLNFAHDDEINLALDQVTTPEGAPTVLTVEDNKDVREYIASVLNGTYHVLQAENGAEGLEMVLQHHPDMIITDVTMPIMDGNEMCRRVKADERINHIPVLMLTARASFEGKLSGLEIGADDYMAKPFNARELHARVKNLIRLRNQDKELKLLNTDLSQQVQIQLNTILEEREQYENKLIVARDKAELSSRLKSSILDNMNHEFRTPLSTILGYSQILVEEAPPEFKEFAEAIEGGGQRLLTTLNGVIDLANVESTDFEVDNEAFNIGEKFESELVGHIDTAKQKGLSLSVHWDSKLNWNRISSPNGFAKIVHHLVDNALKYTDSGSVNASLAQEGRNVILSIQDTGIGMSEAVQQEIFKAFVQGDNGLSRTHEGSGVGLSIVNRLVEKLGGSIEVDSSPGEGSTFRCSIPMKSVLQDRGAHIQKGRSLRFPDDTVRG